MKTGKEYVTPLDNKFLKKLHKEITDKLKEKPKVNDDGTFTICFNTKYSKGQKKEIK